VHLLPVAVKDAAQMAAAEEIYRDLRAAGFDVLMDDREERAGVKFKDADLLGLPIRVTVGNALAKEGVVELRQRRTRTDQRVARAQVVAAVREMAQTIS
jgi:prolyl-tRNA synthetase